MSSGRVPTHVLRLQGRWRRYSRGLAGVLAVAVQVVYLVDGATRRGFDPWRHQISHLSLGERGWLGIVTLAVASLAVLGAAVALGTDRTAGPWRRIAAWLVVPGVGLLVTAAFPTDPGQGYPPGVEAARSWVGAVHDVGGLLVFAGFTAVLLVAGRRLRAYDNWCGWARISLGCAVVVALSWVVGAVLTGMDYSGTWPGAPAGLCERVSFTTALLWLAASCSRPVQLRGEHQTKATAAATR
ncbi:MAG TPA: DUF998 domain-containing protein [Actinopolymorphaceae bacterium]